MPLDPAVIARQQRRRDLWAAGLGDAEIARASGEKRNTITVWRNKAQLAANRPTNASLGHMKADDTAHRMLFYQLGWSDRHIAREENRHRTSIRKWRRLKGLPLNFSDGSQSREKRPGFSDLAARVRKAIGRYLPRDIADDAAANLVLAVLDGTIPLAEIEKASRKFGNKALDTYASRFGPRSLDEEIGDSDGFKMLDLIRDDSHSSWLEEMGATVW